MKILLPGLSLVREMLLKSNPSTYDRFRFLSFRLGIKFWS